MEACSCTSSRSIAKEAQILILYMQSVAPRSGRGLLPFEILEFVDRTLAGRKFTSECTAAYLATIRKFISENIAQSMADIRKRHHMFDALEREDEWDADTDLTMGASCTWHDHRRC